MAEFSTEIEHKKFFEMKKNEIITEEKTLKYSLTKGDRLLLKKYFGYFGQKSKNDAPAYLLDALWVEDDGTEQEKNEIGVSELPRIFDEKDKNKWWKLGVSLTPSEQIAVVRSFQSFSRVYSTDLAFRRFRFGTKIQITGPVSISKKL